MRRWVGSSQTAQRVITSPSSSTRSRSMPRPAQATHPRYRVPALSRRGRHQWTPRGSQVDSRLGRGRIPATDGTDEYAVLIPLPRVPYASLHRKKDAPQPGKQECHSIDLTKRTGGPVSNSARESSPRLREATRAAFNVVDSRGLEPRTCWVQASRSPSSS